MNFISILSINKDSMKINQSSRRKWIEQMRKAVKRMREARDGNFPVIKENREILRRNRYLPEGAPREKTFPLPNPTPQWVKTLIRRELAHKKTLMRKSPDRWLAEIERIPDYAVRMKVASIVYWDYFSGRKCTEAWPHLNYLVDAMPPQSYNVPMIDPKLVEDALFSVGYSPWEAIKRSREKVA
jgi:hypothetical protein